jgi:hypothetical protein
MKERECVAVHKDTGEVIHANSLKEMDMMLGTRTGVGQSCIYNRMGAEKYAERYNTTANRTYVKKVWRCFYKEDYDKL